MFAYPQFGPRRGRALAAMLALAAGSSLTTFAQSAPATAPAAASAAPATSATPAATAPAASTDSSQLQAENDLGTLDWILGLPPERLAALSKALENVEKMPQAERDALRHEIQARMKSLGQLSQAIRGDVQQFTPAERGVLRRYLLTLYVNELQTLEDRFKEAAANADARKQIIQEMLKAAADKGIKPEPTDRNQPGGPRGGPSNGGRGGRGGPQGGRGDHPPMPMPSPMPAPQGA